jgi:hypothetical protein
VESTLGMRERDFYVGCLRSVMIALVVLHHPKSLSIPDSQNRPERGLILPTRSRLPRFRLPIPGWARAQ